MIYLDLSEVLLLHELIIDQTGGGAGIRDRAGLESALKLPQTSYFEEEQYPTIFEKAAILGFAIIKNHPFIDGNKRIGHAVMETFLILNGYEIDSNIDLQEEVIMKVASGEMAKEAFTHWLQTHLIPSEI